MDPTRESFMVDTFVALRTLWPELDVEVFKRIVEGILEDHEGTPFITVEHFSTRLLNGIVAEYGKPRLVVLGFALEPEEIPDSYTPFNMGGQHIGPGCNHDN